MEEFQESPWLTQSCLFNNKNECCAISAISGFVDLWKKPFQISELQFLCCKSKLTISTLHKLKEHMRQCTSGSFGNCINIYDTFKVWRIFTLWKYSSSVSSRRVNWTPNMNQVLVWASHEFSVSGHKLSSVKRLGKEIMRGLEYIISKINMLEKIHFDDSHSLKTMHCFIRISK